MTKRSHLERCFNLLLLLLLLFLLFLLFLFNIYYTLPRNGSFSTRGVAEGDNNYCGLLELPYGIRQSDNNNSKQQQQRNTAATHVDRSFALSPLLTLLLSCSLSARTQLPERQSEGEQRNGRRRRIYLKHSDSRTNLQLRNLCIIAPPIKRHIVSTIPMYISIIYSPYTRPYSALRSLRA